MSVSNWASQTEGSDWDTLFLGDKVVPGVVSVSARVPDPRDKKKGKGAKRASTGDDGEHLIEFDVTVTLAPEEVPEFQRDIMPMLRNANAATSRRPLPVGHPQAYFWNVANVTIGEIGTPSPSSLGDWVISWGMSEWVPAPKKVKQAPQEPNKRTGSAAISNPPPTLAEQALSNSFG